MINNCRGWLVSYILVTLTNWQCHQSQCNSAISKQLKEVGERRELAKHLLTNDVINMSLSVQYEGTVQPPADKFSLAKKQNSETLQCSYDLNKQDITC